MENLTVVQYEFLHEDAIIYSHSLLENVDACLVSFDFQGKKVEVELSFMAVSDPETGVETAYPLADGKKVFANVLTMLQGEPVVAGDSFADAKKKLKAGLTVRGKVLAPELMQIPPREDGLKCSDCELWNREAGVEELEKITHVYQNGSGQMIKEICAAMSTQHKKPMLTSKNVGYCPSKQALTGTTTPGCEDLVKIKE